MKVIDQDTFPSSFYAKELQEDLENAEEINQMGLFIEYVKLVTWFPVLERARRIQELMDFDEMIPPPKFNIAPEKLPSQ